MKSHQVSYLGKGNVLKASILDRDDNQYMFWSLSNRKKFETTHQIHDICKAFKMYASVLVLNRSG